MPEQYDQCNLAGPYTPADSDALNGKTLTFHGEGKQYRFEIVSARELLFSEDGREAVRCHCHVKTMDQEIYFINHLVPGAETARQITFIADTKTGCATVCDARIGTAHSNRDVGREFIFGTLDGEYAGGALHHFTSDLVGKAVIWDYGDGRPEVKHIYNSNLYYTYSMTSPDGAWMATNPADYIKIRDNIYIFSFVEERQPGVQLLLLIDFDRMHDVGSCWGIDASDTFFSACVGAVGQFESPVTIF